MDSKAADGSIRRTVRILNELSTNGPLSLTQLSSALELSPSTVSRFLGILRDEGLVEQCDDRRWIASLAVWRMGISAFERGGWARQGVDDVLRSVTEATGETAVHIVYERGWVTYLAESESPHSIRTHVDVGTRYRAVDVTSGRLLLAYQTPEEIEAIMTDLWGPARWASEGAEFRRTLASIRKDGYAYGGSVVWEGIWGLSVAVPDRHGRMTTAIGISAPDSRRPEDLGPYLDVLREAAEVLSSRLRPGRVTSTD